MNKVLQINPQYGMAYYTLATIYSAKEDYQKAIDNYTNAINSKETGSKPIRTLYRKRDKLF